MNSSESKPETCKHIPCYRCPYHDTWDCLKNQGWKGG